MNVNNQAKSNRLLKTEWQTVVEAWEVSGMTQQCFCKERKLNFNTFTYHRGRLKKKSLPTSKLMPVRVKLENSSPQHSPHFILELVDSKKLAIPQQYDEMALGSLLKLLEG